jgi:SAM-dependent methyltransferase
MNSDRFIERIKSRFPGYKFSWEIYTEIILENVARKPYWLDIGAGPNILIEEQPGFEFAVGLDIQRPENAFAPNRSAYCLADCAFLPFKHSSFDFITSRYTFEHLREPLAALGEVARILKPNGLFAMQTTNKNSPLVIISRMIPFGIKRRIFPVLFKDNPSGTYKAYYRINAPGTLPTRFEGLKLERLEMVEDIMRANPAFLFLSSMLYRLISLFRLESLKGNMIAIYRKDN